MISSLTEEMQICLPTTCKLLGIPRCIGQAVKAALLCKEEAATKVLSTGFCFGQNGLKLETNHLLHFYCCSDDATKLDVDKGKNHNLLDER